MRYSIRYLENCLAALGLEQAAQVRGVHKVLFLRKLLQRNVILITAVYVVDDAADNVVPVALPLGLAANSLDNAQQVGLQLIHVLEVVQVIPLGKQQPDAVITALIRRKAVIVAMNTPRMWTTCSYKS